MRRGDGVSTPQFIITLTKDRACVLSVQLSRGLWVDSPAAPRHRTVLPSSPAYYMYYITFGILPFYRMHHRAWFSVTEDSRRDRHSPRARSDHQFTFYRTERRGRKSAKDHNRDKETKRLTTVAHQPSDKDSCYQVPAKRAKISRV
ncbi:hypothetical protein J6590_019389 [Homalodisca vitripennis]|nr:hypothetical protein J6590_019389 [Homalodisca vitripennis]